MLDNKVITTTVNLDDYSDIYTNNYDLVLKKKLENKFVNKCFKSILIKKIVRIINYSDIMLVDNLLNGIASVDIEFEVEGVILNKNEILSGCKVVKIYSNGLSAQHEIAGLSVESKNNLFMKTIKVGDYISVAIKMAKYSINKPTISASAVPYIPKESQKILFQINQDMKEDEIKKLMNEMKRIEEEEEKHKQFNKTKLYKDLIKFMYPYRSKQNYKKSSVFNKFKMKSHTISDFKKIKKSMFVTYPDEEEKLDKVFYVSTVNKDIKLNFISISAFSFTSHMLTQYYIYLMGIRSLYEFYSKNNVDITKETYYKICMKQKS